MTEGQELWPTEHAASLVENLTQYLTTTFALSDKQAADALEDFLQDPEHGMFRGPYVRLRLPFASPHSQLDGHKPKSLDFYPVGFPPYGHQVEAFRRLTTKSSAPGQFRRPEPTLVTTGTGSGKTESFLFPVLDHVLRAKREGITGIKALILYPMNALANDQANRLTELLTTHPELAGVTAGIYTGQKGPERSKVTSEGLINNSYAMRDTPPDILLTNYKMLDQLLLRAEDSILWNASALSLQYLVLDEFHTYDGAQGTDVAMLLRRLGAALKAHWPSDLGTTTWGPQEADRDKPLGQITPVATSATLGGPVSPGEESPMLRFARTIFGVEFPDTAAVPETRLSPSEWMGHGPDRYARPHRDYEIRAKILSANESLAQDPSPAHLISTVLDTLFEEAPAADRPERIQAALKNHPWTERLLEHAHQAIALPDLAEEILPSDTDLSQAAVSEFLTHVLAVFSHVRKEVGRSALTVETHLWVRELSRLDSVLSPRAEYRWSDDGRPEQDPEADEHQALLPAIYCRHCGSRGWSSMLSPDQLSVEMNGQKIRQHALQRDPKVRALMEASAEVDHLIRTGTHPSEAEGLAVFHTEERTFLQKDLVFKETHTGVDLSDQRRDDFDQGKLLVVRMHAGLKAEDQSKQQVCPVCDTPDAIRFVGSSIATLLSVSVTGLFGADHLDSQEKRTLVFTDSVQDAAHRAGFIQARSHTFTLRTVLRQGLAELADQGQTAPTLTELVDTVLRRADQGEAADRFMLVPPDLTDHAAFKGYWGPAATAAQRRQGQAAVRRRLLFDASLEFGLQARFGRTLELTGAAVVETQIPDQHDLADLAAAALARRGETLDLSLTEDGPSDYTKRARWVRGVLIRMRLQGGVRHPWVEKYLRNDGHRWHLWAGRRRDQGAPAFPFGRSTPAFPRVGGEKPANSELDAVTPAESWYSWWARRSLGIGREEAGHVAKALFTELKSAGIVSSLVSEKTGALIYGLDPDQLRISLTDDKDLMEQRHALQCTACQSTTMGTSRIIQEMSGAPCLHMRCTGELKPEAMKPHDYYRQRLYGAKRTSRVIAREHTSLLPDDVRLTYENQFRGDVGSPAAPNVLVATPTLEMGIDIGSLSTVMLSSMPTSVASYVQRVGRAGRLSGNSLALAFVQGRGEHLPKLHEPLSVINGDVRPPGTYLEADEILRRQFLAYCGDILARMEDGPRPSNLFSILRSIRVEPENYLGRIIGMMRSHGQHILEAFLSQFGRELPTAAQERLQHWALDDSEGETALETRLYRASQQYEADLKEETSRLEQLTAVISELREAVEVARRTSVSKDSKELAEAEQALKTAQRAQLHTDMAIKTMTTREWWISGLERYGLLPNYTLIEDSVELEARVSWLDETEGMWKAEVYPFERGAQAALRELVPGSTFYAQGMQMQVDAVELGPEGSNLRHWQICPSCGWINTELRETGSEEDGAARYAGMAPACPRCSTAAINDTGQVLPVVILNKVSAEMRRDDAAISDRRDDRQRTAYEVLPAADIDLSSVTERWFVKDYAFGVEFLPSVTLRWLNLGASGHHARSRTLVGRDIQAPLFRVCTQCGTQDKNPQSNVERDHRFWCSYRTDVDENSVELALARELTTQGVLLHLPVALVEDDYTIPTLKAALLLGLQEAFGGTPGHLNVLDVPELQDYHDSGYSGQTVLLHDNVPGGTGYLAEFTSPEKVHAMLRAAWEVVDTCACDTGPTGERQLACHECLLPHADIHSLDRVSRSSAERILATLLAGADEGQVDGPMWETSAERPEIAGSGESPLEIRFRDALRRRLEAEGAAIRQDVQNGRTRLSFTLPGEEKRQWRLEPQVDVHNTRPDFLLRAPGVPPVAIYTDGRQYHASTLHNRLDDDAKKRDVLRTHGYLPWALTDQDVQAFDQSQRASGESPDWFNQQLLAKLNPDKKLLAALGSSSMHLLWEWIHRPEPEHFAVFAKSALLATMRGSSDFKPLDALNPEELVPAPPVEGSVLTRQLDPGAGAERHWWRTTSGALDLLVSSEAPTPQGATHPRVLLSLDDSDDALREAGFEQNWRDWLALSTLFVFLPGPDTAIITTSSAADILYAEYPVADADDGSYQHVPQGEASSASELSAEWQEAIGLALSEEEQTLLTELARMRLPVPEVGAELDDGTPVDILYREQGVLALFDAPDGTADELAAAGWTVLEDPTAQAMSEALRSE